jgi:hypothetical protein
MVLLPETRSALIERTCNQGVPKEKKILVSRPGRHVLPAIPANCGNSSGETRPRQLCRAKRHDRVPEIVEQQ